MLPISTKEPVRFTPTRLAGKPDAPTFLLRVPTLRERIALDAAIAAEGVRYPTDAELARTLREAIAEHVVDEQQPELLVHVEGLEVATEEGKQPDPELATTLVEIGATLRPHHRALAEIEAERTRFLAIAMLVRAEMLILGVEGENAPPVERRGGRLTEACGEAIERRYGAGTLYEIGARTVALTNPTADDAKNSASPAPSPPGPATSKAARKRPTGPNGTSSATSIESTLGTA